MGGTAGSLVVLGAESVAFAVVLPEEAEPADWAGAAARAVVAGAEAAVPDIAGAAAFCA
jgi:hypothetical protein